MSNNNFQFFALLITVPSLALAVDSHCKNGETILFSCAIAKSGKLLSLCEGATLVYRFGRKEKVELEYPSAGSAPVYEFAASNEAIGNNGWDAHFSVSFKTPEAQFTVSGSDMRMGGMGADNPGAMTQAGISVVTAKGKTASFQCVDGWVWPDEKKIEAAAKKK